jgi:chaperonin GroEL
MKPKEIQYGAQSRRSFVAGVNKLADAVCPTLGPFGRLVGYTNRFNKSLFTKDGVTVAKEIDLENKFEDLGAKSAREASTKTCDEAGDGTTTSIVLTQKLLNLAVMGVEQGLNVSEIAKGMEDTCSDICYILEKMSESVQNKTDIENIAKIASNGDKDLGKLISDAIEKVGKNGIITVEDSNTGTSSIELKEGLRFNKGYLSHLFVTDFEKNLVELEDANILVTDYEISHFKNLYPILEATNKLKQPLVVICRSLSGDARHGVLFNMQKFKTTLKFAVVEAPSYGDAQEELLKDICCVTGAKFITVKTGEVLKNVTIKDLGSCGKIVINKDSTTIIDGDGPLEAIKERIATIQSKADATSSSYERDQLLERAASLTGGVAIIKVGAQTESALKELKDRVEDALSATRSALVAGYVIGGGMALYLGSEEYFLPTRELSQDYLYGVNTVLESCKEPARRILRNAGIKNADSILEESGKYLGCIYDPISRDYVGYMKTGVIDPTLVVKSALINSVSVAVLGIRTDCMIS